LEYLRLCPLAGSPLKEGLGAPPTGVASPNLRGRALSSEDLGANAARIDGGEDAEK
jgi:hypothetical protein